MISQACNQVPCLTTCTILCDLHHADGSSGGGAAPAVAATASDDLVDLLGGVDAAAAAVSAAPRSTGDSIDDLLGVGTALPGACPEC